VKASNCDLEDLWQGIAYRYEQHNRRIPFLLRLARRIFRGLLERQLRRTS
jgi:hypothetical protein